MERESFVFYRSFWDALKQCPDDVRLQLYDAIADYSLNYKEPEKLEGLANIVFTLIEPQIKANNQKYINGKKGGRYGVLGGRPKLQKTPMGLSGKTPMGLSGKTPMGLSETEKVDNEGGTDYLTVEISGKKQKENNNNIYNNNIYNNNINNIDIDEKRTTDKKEKGGASASTKKQTIKEREKVFKESLLPYIDMYGTVMIEEFASYWTEPNKSKSKMRFEMEKTWDVGRRLSVWERNNFKINKYGNDRERFANDKDAERKKRLNESEQLVKQLLSESKGL